MNKKYPIIIDFVGVGGSGKTYISRILREILAKQCLISSEYKLSIIDIIKYIFTHPIYVIQILIFVLTTKPKNIKSLRQSYFALFNYSIKHFVLSEKNTKYVIFDEGMLHKLRQIRRRSKKNNLSYKDINIKYRKLFFSYPHIVIFLNTPTEIILQRRIKRSNADPEIIKKEFLDLDGNVGYSINQTEEDVKFAAKEQGFKLLIIVNGDDDIIQNDIIAAIEYSKK
jgi:thymidylate kinase